MATPRIYGPRRKPGPKPEDREGSDFYCGVCAGHKVVFCEYCVEGRTRDNFKCRDCGGVGEVVCPGCCGGCVPTRAPDWLPPKTPQPPRCHHAETGENPGAGGVGRARREASRLTADSTPDS